MLLSAWHRHPKTLVLAVGIIVCLATVVTSPTPQAKAADLSQFRAGNIISDEVFFSAWTMNESDIQAFLNQKGSACSGSMCLKNYVDTVPSKSSDQFCAGYPASGSESAARIIYRVANSCGINPQVLLVMLQKEQSLVTRTNPTATAYQKAMGFACPDTTACDSTYYGFGNQVYSAARQFQRYANSGSYTWIKVGQVNQVRYHPNTACGSGSVLIENKATAGLYYYTPYQPNQAALNAGYGTGDACSSYGNRNFYQYFVDWFGNTQSVSSIVQVPGQAEIWLVVGTSKHHITAYADLRVFTSRLGSVKSVPASYLSSLTTGRPATRLVRDPRDGVISMVGIDGAKHRFPDAATLADYGYGFDTYVDLSPSQSDAFTTGPEAGNFFRIEDGPEIYFLNDGTRQYVTTMRAYATAATGKNPYVLPISAALAATFTTGPAILEPNTLVRETSRAEVYLTLGDSGLLHIPSFGLAAELGATQRIVVSDGTLAKNSTLTGSLSPVITCDGRDLLIAGGQAWPISGAGPTGFAAVQLPQAACAPLSISSTQVSAPFFVQIPGKPEVYIIDAGQLHHIRSSDRLRQLNGDRDLTLLPWSAATVSYIGIGAPDVAGTFLQFDGGDEIYQGNGREIRHVTSMDALIRLGGGKKPAIERMPLAWKSYYTTGTPIS
ncbi:MAG: hypothetical protein QM597_07300 [Aeromicrobium sp.]|uniref:hypothetical protein n=1 Tax=Aeromicrobium sp. TaxID=1871063 RepID=UPI0039E71A06